PGAGRGADPAVVLAGAALVPRPAPRGHRRVQPADRPPAERPARRGGAGAEPGPDRGAAPGPPDALRGARRRRLAGAAGGRRLALRTGRAGPDPGRGPAPDDRGRGGPALRPGARPP